MLCQDNINILIALRESAGDIFLITATIDSLKKKYPNSNIFVATSPQFYNILEENPSVKGVLEFDQTMYDYRAYTKWAMNDNPFDIVYAPAVQTQLVPSNWLNGKYAVYLAQFYANACNVKLGETFIKEQDIEEFTLPQEYITVQGQSGQDPKNYDYLNEVISKLKLPIVQIGAKDDKKINGLNIIDLRGQTTFRQAATIIKSAKMHLGLDSVLMHFAAHFKVPSVVIFGGTLPQAAINPEHDFIRVIEPEDRGPCVTSCHLIECAAKQQGYDKCINNVPVDEVLEKCREILSEDEVEQLEPIKISSYLIIKDGVKYGFPFEKAIGAAAKISDEVVVVDGGSTDETVAKLNQLVASLGAVSDIRDRCQIRIEQHEWDLNNPGLFGDEKAYARELCTGTHLIQLDCDEIISEPYSGAIRDLITKNRFNDVLDLPVINFYGDDNTIRIESNVWKWRISRNDPNITHGAHKAARKMDPETGLIVVDKRVSDYCEYIYDDTMEICKHKVVFNPKLLEAHEKIKAGAINKEEYIEALKQVIKESPVIYHYSWIDLSRKEANGEFWDKLWHAKNSWTHNTTEDIINRVKNNENILINVGDLFVKTIQK